MISVNNISIHFTGEDLIKNASFIISDKDIVGLVGKNGSGKTTLLNIIYGTLNPQEGEVIIPSSKTIGFLTQELKAKSNQSVFNEAITAFDELLLLKQEIKDLTKEIQSRSDFESNQYLKLIEELAQKTESFNLLNGNTFHAETEKVLKGLGFSEEDFDKKINTLSKGWQMRIELAKILLKKPDILLLDEPTNHLDIESIQWFEDYLKTYQGAVVLVSHDRTFLDNVAKSTIEISNGKIYDYKVPYSKFIKIREERIIQQKAVLNNQQKEIKSVEKFIERFRYKDTKAKQVQSRVKYLEKMELVELDDKDTSSIHFNFPPAPRSGKVVVEVKDLSKSFGSKVVLKDINFSIGRQEKIAFVGRNGEGKSTLSKIITKELDHSGICKLGHNIQLGYLPQDHEDLLDYNKTVFETIDDVAVGDIRKRILGLLGAFMFGGDEIDKKVKVLSGGEKSRLAIARLLLQPYNLLILDEPTNHLDMQSKDILKNALIHFDGTLIVVSHDRDFLQGLTDKVFEFKDHKIKEYIGDVFDFIESRKITSLNELEKKEKLKSDSGKAPSEQKIKYEQKKNIERNIRKTSKNIEVTEKRISDIEIEIELMNQKLSNPDKIDPGEDYKDLYQKLKKLNQQLDHEMRNWEKFHESLIELENQKNDN